MQTVHCPTKMDFFPRFSSLCTCLQCWVKIQNMNELFYKNFEKCIQTYAILLLVYTKKFLNSYVGNMIISKLIAWSYKIRISFLFFWRNLQTHARSLSQLFGEYTVSVKQPISRNLSGGSGCRKILKDFPGNYNLLLTPTRPIYRCCFVLYYHIWIL